MTPADQAESAEPPFASRSADAALFPMAAWSKGLAVSARQLTPAQLTRDEPQGWPALREQIARYLGAARGIVCDASQVVVLSGIRDGLDLCGRILLTPRDKVLIEDPGYVNAVPIYRPYVGRGAAAHRWPGLCRGAGAACAA